MTDKEKIKSEIERLLRVKEETSHLNQSDFNSGRWKGLMEIKRFVDSLPEEPVSEDLEEEIKRFAYTLPYSKTGAIKSAGWVHKWTLESVMQIGKHIAQWQKDRLINQACKWWEEEFSYHTMTQEEKEMYQEKVAAFRKAIE